MIRHLTSSNNQPQLFLFIPTSQCSVTTFALNHYHSINATESNSLIPRNKQTIQKIKDKCDNVSGRNIRAYPRLQTTLCCTASKLSQGIFPFLQSLGKTRSGSINIVFLGFYTGLNASLCLNCCFLVDSSLFQMTYSHQDKM